MFYVMPRNLFHSFLAMLCVPTHLKRQRKRIYVMNRELVLKEEEAQNVGEQIWYCFCLGHSLE